MPLTSLYEKQKLWPHSVGFLIYISVHPFMKMWESWCKILIFWLSWGLNPCKEDNCRIQFKTDWQRCFWISICSLHNWNALTAEHRSMTSVFFLIRLCLACPILAFVVYANDTPIPQWISYVKFHVHRPLGQYFSQGANPLNSNGRLISSTYTALEIYVRLSKQHCDIPFCSKNWLFQNNTYHHALLTWPCGTMCHDDVNQTSTFDWRIKVNAKMRLNITIINMQLPYGTIRYICNLAFTFEEETDASASHLCRSLYNVMTYSHTGDVRLRLQIYPEVLKAQIFSGIYQVVDPLFTQHTQPDKKQMERLTLGLHRPVSGIQMNDILIIWWHFQVEPSDIARVELRGDDTCTAREFSLVALDGPPMFPIHKSVGISPKNWFPITRGSGYAHSLVTLAYFSCEELNVTANIKDLTAVYQTHSARKMAKLPFSATFIRLTHCISPSCHHSIIHLNPQNYGLDIDWHWTEVWGRGLQTHDKSWLYTNWDRLAAHWDWSWWALWAHVRIWRRFYVSSRRDMQ